MKKKYTLSREIEANNEIQSTQINRRIATWACLIFALLVVSVPFIQITTQGWPQKWTDDWLRTSCYMENSLTSHYQQLLTEYFHSGNEKAILGENGWLFYTPDIEYLIQPIDSSSISCILDMQKQLEERGIQLILLPTPLKPMICAHNLDKRFDPKTQLIHPDFSIWKKKLEEEGITIIDPTIELQNLHQSIPAFLQSDTHWSPEGMNLVAKQLANTIQKEALLTQSQTYQVIDSSILHRGDIYSMLRLSDEISWIPMEQIKTNMILDEVGNFHSRQSTAEILLLGDSFTNIYSVGNMGWGRSSGLAEELSFLLQAPIDIISQNDNGSYATRKILQDKMAKGEDRLNGKKIIIWQFAMRELTQGKWEKINFELGSSSDMNQYLTLEENEKVTLEATLSEIASIPHPSNVTYEEHVIALRITNIEGFPDKEALVYVMAMEKRKLLPAANLCIDDRITLTLENWGEHEAIEGAFNRSELDSDITLNAQPLWGILQNNKK